MSENIFNITPMSLSRSGTYLTNQLTANAILSLVHWTRYRRTLITLNYGVLRFKIVSSSSLSLNGSYLWSKEWMTIGVLNGWDLLKLKRFKIFSV